MRRRGNWISAGRHWASGVFLLSEEFAGRLLTYTHPVPLLTLLLSLFIQSPAKPPITIDVALTINGASYAAKGAGECVFSDKSSLYDVAGSQWGARHHDDARSLNFSLWRLSKGGDMVTLSIDLAGKTHTVNTVTVGPAANRKGSGSATFEKRGAGGVFTLNAVAETGAKISGTIACSGFVPPEDNGLEGVS